MSEQGVSRKLDPVRPSAGLKPLAQAEWERYTQEAVRKLRERGVPQRNERKVSEAMSELQEIGDKDRIVFSVTVSYKYETTGEKLKEYYGTSDLTEAANIDSHNLRDDPQFIADDLNHSGRDYNVRISAARFTGV